MAQSVEQFTRNEQAISSNLITSSKKYRQVFGDIFLSLKISNLEVDKTQSAIISLLPPQQINPIFSEKLCFRTNILEEGIEVLLVVGIDEVRQFVTDDVF